MTRMQFFRIMEGGGSRKSKMFRRQAAGGMLKPIDKRAGIEGMNKRAAQVLSAGAKEGKMEVAKRVVRSGAGAAAQDIGKFAAKHGKKVLAGLGVGAAGLGAAKMAMRAKRPAGTIEKIGHALKSNPKAAAGAAAAAAGGLMFMRKKSNKKSKK